MKRFLEFFKDEIAFYSAMGLTMEQIADLLYEQGEICYWERDIMKGEKKDESTRSK